VLTTLWLKRLMAIVGKRYTPCWSYWMRPGSLATVGQPCWRDDWKWMWSVWRREPREGDGETETKSGYGAIDPR
jgi:hypothetical protein